MGYTLPHLEQVKESPFRARLSLQLGQKGENSCIIIILWYYAAVCQIGSHQARVPSLLDGSWFCRL